MKLENHYKKRKVKHEDPIYIQSDHVQALNELKLFDNCNLICNVSGAFQNTFFWDVVNVIVKKYSLFARFVVCLKLVPLSIHQFSKETG